MLVRFGLCLALWMIYSKPAFATHWNYLILQIMDTEVENQPFEVIGAIAIDHHHQRMSLRVNLQTYTAKNTSMPSELNGGELNIDFRVGPLGQNVYFKITPAKHAVRLKKTPIHRPGNPLVHAMLEITNQPALWATHSKKMHGNFKLPDIKSLTTPEFKKNKNCFYGTHIKFHRRYPDNFQYASFHRSNLFLYQGSDIENRKIGCLQKQNNLSIFHLLEATLTAFLLPRILEGFYLPPNEIPRDYTIAAEITGTRQLYRESEQAHSSRAEDAGSSFSRSQQVASTSLQVVPTPMYYYTVEPMYEVGGCTYFNLPARVVAVNQPVSMMPATQFPEHVLPDMQTMPYGMPPDYCHQFRDPDFFKRDWDDPEGGGFGGSSSAAAW